MAPSDETEIERTKRLNDEMRSTMSSGEDTPKYGIVTLTSGVSERGDGFAYRAISGVLEFDQFDADNDPHGEHDFGAFEVDGEKLFWKIDYYDLDCQKRSIDPANPKETMRVLTILLASEY